MSIFGNLSTPKWLNPDEESYQSAMLAGQQADRWHKQNDNKMQLGMEQQQLNNTQQDHIIKTIRDKQLMDYQTQSNAGQAVMAGKMAEIAKSGKWNDPAARSEIFDVGAKFPALVGTKAWLDTMDNFQKADKMTAEAEHWRTQAQTTQDKLDLEHERNNILGEKLNSPDKPSKMLDEIDAEKAAADKAKAAGDTAEYQRHMQRANDLDEMLPRGTGLTISRGQDDQGRPIETITTGKKGANALGGTTVATASMEQQKAVKYQNAVQLINGLQKSLRPEDVGGQGLLGEYVIDRGLAQLDPRLANKTRVANRDMLTIAKESLMREIGDDRRFTAQDREDIAAALPSNGAFESYPAAMKKMEVVRGVIVDRMRNWADRTGNPVPPFAQTKEEIASGFKRKKAALEKAVETKTIDSAEAQKQIDQEQSAAMDALMKYH